MPTKADVWRNNPESFKAGVAIYPKNGMNFAFLWGAKLAVISTKNEEKSFRSMADTLLKVEDFSLRSLHRVE